MSDCTACSTVWAIFVLGRPDVGEEHVRAVRVLPERVVDQVDVHRPGQRVGDDERRRGQVVHLHVGVDAPLEVAVARQHRADRQVVGVDGRGDLVRERTGVADSGRASIADRLNPSASRSSCRSARRR